ncbi:MAG: hypothetical protein HZA37_02445 [Parcubacteria group bacterium]|nr:hypothetical protein [Parcubacteria group bacterium]
MIPEIINSVVEVFSAVWWIVLPLTLFFVFRDLWLQYVRGEYRKSIQWVTLEVKVSRNILKTPKAMEQIFAAAHATYSFGIKPFDKWWEGKIEDWTSFEIVGHSGGVYFFIRTAAKYRNLIESAVYSQYPDAEIRESDDYTDLFPSVLPNKTYDIWGCDFILARESAYPIRTYPYFEATVEEQRLDPVAAVTEVMSKLKEGETIWLQVLIRPTGDSWKKEGEEIVGKLIGKKPAVKSSFLSEVGEFAKNLLIAPFGEPVWSEKSASAASAAPPLTPGGKEIIKEVENKISKIGFETDIRFIYIDRKDSFTRSNIAAIMGAFRQFNTQNLNAFRPASETITVARQPFKKKKEYLRKRFLYWAYRVRLMPVKLPVLNIEELATIYHYPTMYVEAPMLRHVESKKGGAPVDLPIE